MVEIGSGQHGSEHRRNAEDHMNSFGLHELHDPGWVEAINKNQLVSGKQGQKDLEVACHMIERGQNQELQLRQVQPRQHSL